jgi:putative transposase
MRFGKSDFGNTPFATTAIFERCADYIHFNPVKHRLVTSPAAWPFSSMHRYVRAGVLSRDWGVDGRANDGNFGERGD